MADRTVLYRLIADSSQFTAGMASARAQSAQTGVALESTAKKSTAAVSAVEMAGLGLAAALAGKTVMAAANFEEAMSGVQAATHESAATMDTLRDAALEAGATTKFSATEAAAGIENLAKAGVTTSDILNGGLAGALDLAAAGELEVGAAAEIAATALTQFNLAGEDVPHVADLLAAGAGKAQGEVTDLSQALNQAGLVAGQMDLSIEETVGTLSAFASAGLLGSDAGTSLKTMLLRLANPSKEAAQEMERFGISAYDAQGNMLPMSEIAGQVQKGFEGQSQATRDAALATIFGSDAIRAANVLYSEGADGITEWTAKVDDAGYAAETAGIRMDNLKGDLEILMGSFETALIGAGDGSQDSLRSTTQAATGLLDVLNEINSMQAVSDTTDSLALGGISPDVLTIGLSSLKKTKDAIFGVDEATKDSATSTQDAAEADRLLAAEQTRLGQTAQFAAEATQKSAAELEAQAKALEDARKAARATADGFVGLGDSLNDSKKSLGQWLNEMQSTREALENFTENARRAGKRGLDEGLIKSLAEAGPEGARRMRELANASEKELGRANREFRGTEGAVKDLAKLLMNIPQPKLKVDNGKAISEIDALEARLRAIRDEDVFINVRRIGATTTGPRNEAADGGSVPKGGAYFDKHLYMLAPGEEIISNRHGQADAFRSDRAAGRIPGYADGGTTGKKRKKPSGGFNEGDNSIDISSVMAAADAQLAAANAQAQAAVNAQRAAEVSLLAAQDQDDAADKALAAAQTLYDGVMAQTAGLFGIDPLAQSDNPWGASDPFAKLTDVIDRSGAFAANATTLAGRTEGGFTGAALEYGLSSESNLAQLMAMSDADLQRFEDLYNQAQAGVTGASTTAADLTYGGQLAEAKATAAGTEAAMQAQITQLQNVNGTLSVIQQTVSGLESQMGEFAQLVGQSAAGGVAYTNNQAARRARRD